MSRPVATIGIPCRDAEPWIAAAVDSALAQKDCEVIVVDDASRDASRAVLERYGDRIRLLDGGGNGAPVARNRVLAKARGRWVQYLDADDCLLPGKIATQLAEAEAFPKGTVPFAPVLSEVWKEGAPISRAADPIDPGADIATLWISWQMPQTSGVLWPKDVLQSLGGWKVNQPCCQEHELYARAIRHGIPFGFTPTALAVYRLWSEETLCRRDPLRVIRVRSGLIEEMLAWLEANGRLRNTHRDAAGRAFFTMSRTMAQHDPAAAAAFHAHWKSRGFIRPSGPAAPRGYLLFYHLFGFRIAERIACTLR